MENQFSRTELLIGKKAVERLKNARVAVFGIGGVGGHVLEALVRSGVGTVDTWNVQGGCGAAAYEGNQS